MVNKVLKLVVQIIRTLNFNFESLFFSIHQLQLLLLFFHDFNLLNFSNFFDFFQILNMLVLVSLWGFIFKNFWLLEEPLGKEINRIYRFLLVNLWESFCNHETNFILHNILRVWMNFIWIFLRHFLNFKFWI